MNRFKTTGFTLIEAMVVIAIIGILMAIAFPSYQRMIERNKLKQVAESLKSDMQLARTEAIKRSKDVVLSRHTGTSGSWCYGLTEQSSCDCTTVNDCEIKQISGGNFSSIVNMASANNNSTFGFRRGTIDAGNITFSTTNYQARVVFSNTGRIKTCTPSGATGIIGYPAC
jgi:type IV fimbrial biogenesis protein FimT